MVLEWGVYVLAKPATHTISNSVRLNMFKIFKKFRVFKRYVQMDDMIVGI